MRGNASGAGKVPGRERQDIDVTGLNFARTAAWCRHQCGVECSSLQAFYQHAEDGAVQPIIAFVALIPARRARVLSNRVRTIGTIRSRPAWKSYSHHRSEGRQMADL
jgi:hypothetical protein